MSTPVRLSIAVVLAAAGAVAAVLARDEACLMSLPPQCSRSFGLISAAWVVLGLGAACLWLLSTRHRTGHL